MNIDKLTKLKVGALFCEAGTGKTKTICELIDYKLNNKKVNKICYILPASLKKQTQEEVAKWTINKDKFNFFSIEGIGASNAIYNNVNNFVDNKTILIIDESLKIKNLEAKRTKRILALSKKCEYKFILNGTPISKNYYDLYTQMYFLSPNILGYNSMEEFYKNHFRYWKDNPKFILETFNIDWLIKKIDPYIIEEKLNLNIEKNKFIVPCRFNENEILNYEMNKNNFINDLSDLKDKPEAAIYALFVRLQRIKCEDKLIRLKEVLQGLKHIIIVCRYLDEIEILRDFFNNDCDIYTGETKQLTNKNILIISLQAGSFGLNLQHYNNMVFFSKWFDYATQEQMEHRIFRRNQSKDVNYYHLININNPVEKMIENSLHNKRNILNVLKKEIKGDREWKKQLHKMFEIQQ